MVPTKAQRPGQLVTRLVELQVASSVIKLLVLDDVGLGIAQVSEDVIVEIQATFVHTFLSLALATHTNHGLKFSQSMHC